MDGWIDGWMKVYNAHTHTHSRTEGSVSLTQLRHQSLICFVVKAVLFLISVVMEMLRCHTTLEVSFCNEEDKKKKSSVLQLYCLYILPFNYLFIVLKYSDSDGFAAEHFRKIDLHIFIFV